MWLFELADLEDPASLEVFIAENLALQRRTAGDVGTELLDHLSSRTMLLVLDNCEHLIDAVARLADRMLRSCAGLRILATSREALSIAGERTLRVAPLPIPESGGSWSPTSLGAHDSVSLFAERAAGVDSSFRLTERTGSDVLRSRSQPSSSCHRRTARGHVENIFTKLGFNTRAQVATWYAERSASEAPS